MTTAIGYTRLSQDSDTSIDRQKRHIREYCERESIGLQGILNDGQYSSGFDTDRSEYQQVRDRVRSGEIDAVVVNDRTRIGRDYDERMRFILDLREYDVELHTRKGRVDLSNPTNVAVEGVHAAKDDEGKREEIEKAKEATEERLEQGYDHGRPPFGLTFDEDGHYWVPGDDFDAALEVLEMRDDGASYRAIAEEIDEVGRESARGILQRREKYEKHQDEHEVKA
jgi:DNA invertase Pin-like site-specific DNA recombinase